MRHPSILDVIHAVKQGASAHPEVRAWWYTPPQRLRLSGELPRTHDQETPTGQIEVVLQGDSLDAGALDPIASELSHAMAGEPVGVRVHAGASEARPLFRIVSQRDVGRADGHREGRKLAPH
jgi:hypothetical protein